MKTHVGIFEKVSFDQFLNDMKNMSKDCEDINSQEFNDKIKKIYDDIKIPKRKTYESAGYDFYLPMTMVINQGESLLIPTGIRIKLDPGYSLDIYPRSGLGTKYKIVIANTIGVIDSDYYNSDNEGHIFIKLVYEGFSKYDECITLNAGDRFCQGIIHEVFTVENDEENDEFIKRNGGYGSTDEIRESK